MFSETLASVVHQRSFNTGDQRAQSLVVALAFSIIYPILHYPIPDESPLTLGRAVVRADDPSFWVTIWMPLLVEDRRLTFTYRPDYCAAAAGLTILLRIFGRASTALCELMIMTLL